MSFSRANRTRKLCSGLAPCSMACPGVSLPGFHRLPALVVHVGDHRLHDQQRQKQREAEQHLIGGRGLRSERLPQKVQHHHDAQKRRDRHDRRRQQRHQRQQDDDLHRHAERGAVLTGRDAEERERFARRAPWLEAPRQGNTEYAAVSPPDLRCPARKASPPESIRRARMPAAVRSRPRAPGAACAAARATAAPGTRIRRAAALLPATRRQVPAAAAPTRWRRASSSTTATAAICWITSICIPSGQRRTRRPARQKSSRKSVMRTPSEFSITTISPEPQSTPPM